MPLFEVQGFVGRFPVWLVLGFSKSACGEWHAAFDRVLAVEEDGLKWAAVFTDDDLADRAVSAERDVGRLAMRMRVPDAGVFTLNLLCLHSLRTFAGITFDPDMAKKRPRSKISLDMAIGTFRTHAMAWGQ